MEGFFKLAKLALELAKPKNENVPVVTKYATHCDCAAWERKYI